MTWILALLVAVKSATGVLVAAGLAGAAGWTVADIRRRPVVTAARVTLFGALALVALTRGAAHNNPLVYGVFDRLGVPGLLAVVLAVLGGGAAIGLALGRRRQIPAPLARLAEGRGLGLAVAGFAVLALLASAEQVVRYWDVPGWGDSVSWDLLTHAMARGEFPAGSSYYMPAYQYAAAALFKVFGHAFFVPQLANVALAPLTVLGLALAMRALTRSGWPVLMVAALAASHDYLRYTAHIMQIENWYIPAVAMMLWAACRHAVRPGIGAAVLIGLTAGIAFSFRAQGAFFTALMVLAPLMARQLPLAARARHVMVAGLVFAAVLAPWTARNYVVTNRLSPAGSQGAMHMAMSADPRGYWGIRRDLLPPTVWSSWQERYPDAGERERAMVQYAFDQAKADPARALAGVWWRSLTFYGLLPEEFFAPGGPKPMDVQATGKTWLLRNMAILCVLLAAGIGLLLRRDRHSAFLVAGVAANMVVVLTVGFSEARIHYPMLTLFFLLAGLGATAVPAGPTAPLFPPAAVRRLWWLVPGLAVLGIVGHLAWGRHNLVRAIQEPALTVGCSAGPAPEGTVPMTLGLTNHHLPVKWYAETVKAFPKFASDPTAPNWFYAVHVRQRDGVIESAGTAVALKLAGACADVALREQDVVEVDARPVPLEAGRKSAAQYFEAVRVRRVGSWKYKDIHSRDDSESESQGQ